MANCTWSNFTVINRDLISCTLAILSLVMCVVAIAILIYYKLYHSFNYRLILYLLISFLIGAIVNSVVVPLPAWYFIPKHPYSDDLCKAEMIIEIFLSLYYLWNEQLSIAFMTAEVFSMIVFSVELRKAEVPLTLACFTLPILAPILQVIFGRRYFSSCVIVPNSNGTTTVIDYHLAMYHIIPGMIITGICVVAIVTAMSCLAYRSLQWHFIGRDNEEQYLLHKHARKRYQNALKESLPFAVYPITMQLVLVVLYLFIIQCTLEENYMYINIFIDGSSGSVASTIFFIHVKALGRHRRNTFRKKSRVAVPNNTVEEVNEEQRLTNAGSITGTHVTEFDPLGESDIEPNT